MFNHCFITLTKYEGESAINILLQMDFKGKKAMNREEIMEARMEKKKYKVTKEDISKLNNNYSVLFVSEEDAPVLVVNKADEKIPFLDAVSNSVTDDIINSLVPVYFTEEQKNIVAQENIHLATHMAGRYSNYKRMEFEDLEGLAMLGFTKALNSYDLRLAKQIKFSTFCCTCIENIIRTEMEKTNRCVDTSSESCIFLDATFEKEENPSDKLFSEIFSCDNVISQDYSIKSVEKTISNDYKIKSLNKCIESLSLNEQYFICSAYGCFYYEKKKQTELARELGLTQCSVSKRLDSIKKKLKEKLMKEYSIFSAYD